MNGEVPIPKEWIKGIATWTLVVVVSAFSGGMMRVDPYYGSQGRQLEAKIIEMEVLLNQFLKKLDEHSDYIKEAPRARDLHVLQARVKSLEGVTQQLLLEIRTGKKVNRGA